LSILRTARTTTSADTAATGGSGAGTATSGGATTASASGSESSEAGEGSGEGPSVEPGTSVAAIRDKGIGLKKGDDELRDFVNDVLEQSYADGSWKDAFDRTVGESGQKAPTPPPLDRY